MWQSKDGTVFGELNWSTPNIIEINNWYSEVKGCGNTTKALKELRNEYPDYELHAVKVINPAQEYWVHMKRKGLIDKIFDYDNNEELGN